MKKITKLQLMLFKENRTSKCLLSGYCIIALLFMPLVTLKRLTESISRWCVNVPIDPVPPPRRLLIPLHVQSPASHHSKYSISSGSSVNYHLSHANRIYCSLSCLSSWGLSCTCEYLIVFLPNSRTAVSNKCCSFILRFLVQIFCIAFLKNCVVLNLC